MAEEEKKVVRKPRQVRIPHVAFGKEANVRFEDGVFKFYASLTTTIDSWGDIPVGRIRVPSGYVLLVNGTEQNVKKHLIVPEQIVKGDTYLSVFCTNASPELRRVYQGDVVAKGVLIRIAEKAELDIIE